MDDKKNSIGKFFERAQTAIYEVVFGLSASYYIVLLFCWLVLGKNITHLATIQIPVLFLFATYFSKETSKGTKWYKYYLIYRNIFSTIGSLTFLFYYGASILYPQSVLGQAYTNSYNLISKSTNLFAISALITIALIMAVITILPRITIGIVRYFKDIDEGLERNLNLGSVFLALILMYIFGTKANIEHLGFTIAPIVPYISLSLLYIHGSYVVNLFLRLYKKFNAQKDNGSDTELKPSQTA